MPIGVKLTLWITLGSSCVLAVYGVLEVRREQVLFERANREYGEVIGYELASRAASLWERHGKQAALEMLDALDSRARDVTARWVPEAKHVPENQRDELMAGRHVSVVRERSEHTKLTVTYVPVPLDQPDAGFVEVVESFQHVDAYVEQSIGRLAMVLAAVAVVNAIIILLVSAWLVGRPVAKLVVKAHEVGRGEFSTPVDVGRSDELGRLGKEMARMSEELNSAQQQLEAQACLQRATEEQLRHAERLATVGKLGAGMAHEIGTPLNVISGRAKMIARKSDDRPELVQSASIIREQADRISTILRQLLDFARRQGARQQVTDLPRLARHTVSLLEPTVRKRSVEVAVVAEEEGLNASLDSTQMQQVLTNLVMNAVHATPGGGAVELRLSPRDAVPPTSMDGREQSCVAICVADHGEGIAPDNLPHIFEPFFTTKDVGEGTGLGLAVAHGIVTDHGGWIEVDSEPGRGSLFTVYLPRAQKVEDAA